MTPQEEKQIVEFNKRIESKIHIHFVATRDKRSKELKKFCDNLTSLAPKISVTKKNEDTDNVPHIRIRPNIHFHATPLGSELDPFLNSLSLLQAEAEKPQPTKPVHEKLDLLGIPARLKLYVSGMCPFCPVMTEQLFHLAFGNKFMRLSIIDAVLFQEIAKTDNIRSVPTLIFDDFQWTGKVNTDELIEMMIDRDPSRLGPESIKGMIEEGSGPRLVKMMLNAQSIFPGLIELLTYKDFSIRLGAMVLMEEIADQDIAVAARAVEPLLKRLPGLEDQISGDIIYVIGESGNSEIINRLEAIKNDSDNPEIEEAVEDAIATIMMRVTN